MKRYYLEVASFLVKDDSVFPPDLTDMPGEAQIYTEETKRGDTAAQYGGKYREILVAKANTDKYPLMYTLGALYQVIRVTMEGGYLIKCDNGMIVAVDPNDFDLIDGDEYDSFFEKMEERELNLKEVKYDDLVELTEDVNWTEKYGTEGCEMRLAAGTQYLIDGIVGDLYMFRDAAEREGKEHNNPYKYLFNRLQFKVIEMSTDPESDNQEDEVCNDPENETKAETVKQMIHNIFGIENYEHLAVLSENAHLIKTNKGTAVLVNLLREDGHSWRIPDIVDERKSLVEESDEGTFDAELLVERIIPDGENFSLYGYIYNDKSDRFEDGQDVTTSTVRSYNKDYYAITENTTYKLIKERK